MQLHQIIETHSKATFLCDVKIDLVMIMINKKLLYICHNCMTIYKTSFNVSRSLINFQSENHFKTHVDMLSLQFSNEEQPFDLKLLHSD